MARSDAGGRGGRPVVPFVVLAFGWSWAWWWTAAGTGGSATEAPGALLYLLGVFGPLVGAIWVVGRAGGAYRREFLRRIWDPRRVPAVWWLALLAVVVGPAAFAAVGLGLAGMPTMAGDVGAGAVAGMVVFALVAGIAEEPGWRGAAADALQARTRPMWAAAGIGVVWSLWHLPLSFVEGSYYHDLGLGSTRFWLTHLMLVQLGVLLVWLTNGSGGSVLVAVLAHAGFNVAIGLVADTLARDVVALLVLTLATGTVGAVTRGRLCLAWSTTPSPQVTSSSRHRW